MNKFLLHISAVFILGTVCPLPLGADDDGAIESAKVFFEEFVALGHAFDLDLVDLYSDSAIITITEKAMFGRVKTRVMAGHEFKRKLARNMLFARMMGEKSHFHDVIYEREGDSVRITATRYFVRKDYERPYSLLIAPDERKGNWIVQEEIINAR